MYVGSLKILPGKMIFSKNKASVGGAIVISKSDMYCHAEAYIVFSRNKAIKEGGAIGIYNSSVTGECFMNFTGNFAEVNGGGIFLVSQVTNHHS